MTEQPALVLVSNRGPVTYQEDGSIKRGTGGLVTALTGLASHRDAIWVAGAMERERALALCDQHDLANSDLEPRDQRELAQRDLGEAAELAGRPADAGVVVADVELHHFGAGSVAGVRDVHRHHEVLPRGHGVVCEAGRADRGHPTR